MTLRPDNDRSPATSRIPTAGSLLLLLAAMCTAYVGPGRQILAPPAAKAVAGWKAPAAQAIKARILGRLSLGRRHAVRGEFHTLYAGLLSLPASIAFATAPDRLHQPLPIQRRRFRSSFPTPSVSQRPPPSLA